MPFEIGNKLGETAGGGRKGYEIEQEQLDLMRSVATKDLKWLQKMQEKKELGEDIDDNTLELMKVTATRVNKILDKLHASKQDLTSDGKAIVINVAPEIAAQNDIEPKFKSHPDVSKE